MTITDEKPNGVAYTHVGGRSNNEDAFLTAVADGCLLLAVADGLGGAEAGELASASVKGTLRRLFEAAPAGFDPDAAIRRANAELLALQHTSGKKMKTTVAVLYIRGGEAVCGHVGDSRLYLFGGDGAVLYQSVDHSVAQLHVFTGEITPAEIRGNADRNLLTKALGETEECAPEMAAFPARDLRAALLCSDGFWEYVYEAEMEELLRRHAPDARGWLVAMKRKMRERQPQNCDNNTAVAVIF